ncbi:hypothetical protein BM221_009208 [Beauveria bassiana]|uniref:Uncharacterized protein n=1 Tax=Beauveria bassiana TaxID=176275 RepID=A0A2N6NCL5_BEABA|nr:hypothetical protein BM221_009208 [Beauveria bassiana]
MHGYGVFRLSSSCFHLKARLLNHIPGLSWQMHLPVHAGNLLHLHLQARLHTGRMATPEPSKKSRASIILQGAGAPPTRIMFCRRLAKVAANDRAFKARLHCELANSHLTAIPRAASKLKFNLSCG